MQQKTYLMKKVKFSKYFKKSKIRLFTLFHLSNSIAVMFLYNNFLKYNFID